MDNNKSYGYDLNALVETYNIDNDYEQYKRHEFLEKLQKYIVLENASILELGSATGQMTQILTSTAKEIIAVDGSKDFIEIAKERVGNTGRVIFYESYFEDFSIDKKFDCLVMHHILEHIEDPVSLLIKSKDFIKNDGYIAISVPNAFALSRQLAVKMGLLSSVYELTPNDIYHGHFRVYDLDGLVDHLEKSGFEIVGKHGLSFKLFSDKQNVEMLNNNIIGESQIKGLWLLGDDYLNLAGAIMIVARIKK